MKLKNLFKYFHKPSIAKGNSLYELLVAVSMTTVIITASGFGLQAMLQTNKKTQAHSGTLHRLNRATEFISAEIRSAIKVETDAADAVDPSSGNETPSFSLPSGAIPVLALQMSGVFQRVVYYVHTPDDDRLGPNVLYRWGPSFDESGEYTASEIENPALWVSTPLVDFLDTETIATPGCETDWEANPPSNAQGFYTCVNSNNPRLVEIHMSALINRTTGDPVSKEISTKVFARADVTEGGSSTVPSFSIVGKTLTLDDPANLTFEVIGGSITCGSGGPAISVTTKLYLNDSLDAEDWDSSQPLSLPALGSGTTVNVESNAYDPDCFGGVDNTVSSTNSSTPKLQVLVDGDPVPDQPAFDNQTRIDEFLKDYIEDGKIKLPDNQVIYLFELGGGSPGSLAFDMQDNVVLATIESPY